MTVRLFSLLAALLVAAPAFAQNAFLDRDPTMPMTAAAQAAMTPMDALQALMDGNGRFLRGESLELDFLSQINQTSTGQYPMAIILGCIDSRVPHEIIFDKGVGDVFSARVAGNFVNTDILGSMEFATAAAGAKLVVVLGHTECGAIKGACDHVQLGNLTSMLANIVPAVYSVDDIEGPRTSANAAFVQAVADENVEEAVEDIVEKSQVMRGLVESGRLIVIGAMHDVSTGRVTFDTDGMMTAETLRDN